MAGRTRVTFTLQPGWTVRHTSAAHIVADWILATRTLDRTEIRLNCAAACNNTGIIQKAIYQLSASGHIRKERGIWVWVEGK